MPSRRRGPLETCTARETGGVTARRAVRGLTGKHRAPKTCFAPPVSSPHGPETGETHERRVGFASPPSLARILLSGFHPHPSGPAVNIGTVSSLLVDIYRELPPCNLHLRFTATYLD